MSYWQMESADYKYRPLVSLIMSVHNENSEYLNLAIKSILDQTYEEIELVVVDDGSVNEIKYLLRDWVKRDSRFRLFRFDKNIGLTKALNFCLRNVNGEYIARHDSDDFSALDRIEKQVLYLLSNESVDAVGSYAHLIDSKGIKLENIAYDFDKIKLKRVNHLVHGSMMFRREVFSMTSGYDERLVYAQDFGLYLKMVFKHEMNIYVIPRFLYNQRKHTNSISSRRAFEQLYYAVFAKRLVFKPQYVCRLTLTVNTIYDYVFVHYFFKGYLLRRVMNKIKLRINA